MMKVPRNFAPAVPQPVRCSRPLWRRLASPLFAVLAVVALLLLVGLMQHLDMRDEARQTAQRERAAQALNRVYQTGVDDGYSLAALEAAANQGCLLPPRQALEGPR